MRAARRFRHLVRHSLLVLMTGAALVFPFAAAAQNAGSVKELAGQAFAGTSAGRRTLEPQAAILHSAIVSRPASDRASPCCWDARRRSGSASAAGW